MKLTSYLLIFLCPIFVFATISGKDLMTNKQTTIDLNNKKTVVFFLSSKCPCSKNHVLYIKEMTEGPKYKDFQFVGINSNLDEKIDFSQNYFQSLKFKFPIIRDEGQVWADKLGALKTPHAYILDGEQIIYQGGIVNSRNPARKNLKHYLKNALNDILETGTPKVDKTRTLGCRIKR